MTEIVYKIALLEMYPAFGDGSICKRPRLGFIDNQVASIVIHLPESPARSAMQLSVEKP